MPVVDGLAIYGVSENRLAETKRKPYIQLYLTSTPINKGEWEQIRGLVLVSESKVQDLIEARQSDWAVIELTFDPNLGLYHPRSARWCYVDYSWSKTSGSSISILGDGIKELDRAYSLLQVEPDRERLTLRSKYSGWDLDLDMTMWVRQKY